jgi:osmotically-inducible protein OsmY
MAKTDNQLQEDVLFELDYEPSVDASRIGVTVKDGIVSLSGTVTNYAEKYAAVQAARRVAGVRAVTDEMKVQLPSLHVRNDADIAKAALSALEWNVWVPRHSIELRVDDGWITLEGEVKFYHQKNAAEFSVRHLTGVTGVSNLIVVKRPLVSSSEVKTTIESALRRGAETEADHIEVDVEDQKVTLRGTVSSWAERQEAERAAWSAPGVCAVVDHLVISA